MPIYFSQIEMSKNFSSSEINATRSGNFLSLFLFFFLGTTKRTFTLGLLPLSIVDFPHETCFCIFNFASIHVGVKISKWTHAFLDFMSNRWPKIEVSAWFYLNSRQPIMRSTKIWADLIPQFNVTLEIHELTGWYEADICRMDSIGHHKSLTINGGNTPIDDRCIRFSMMRSSLF